MLIPKLGALKPSNWVRNMSRPRDGVTRVTSFQVYRNGVLDHVMNGPESLARDRIAMLGKLHPEDRWDWAPARHWRDVGRV